MPPALNSASSGCAPKHDDPQFAVVGRLGRPRVHRSAEAYNQRRDPARQSSIFAHAITPCVIHFSVRRSRTTSVASQGEACATACRGRKTMDPLFVAAIARPQVHQAGPKLWRAWLQTIRSSWLRSPDRGCTQADPKLWRAWLQVETQALASLAANDSLFVAAVARPRVHRAGPKLWRAWLQVETQALASLAANDSLLVAAVARPRVHRAGPKLWRAWLRTIPSSWLRSPDRRCTGPDPSSGELGYKWKPKLWRAWLRWIPSQSCYRPWQTRGQSATIDSHWPSFLNKHRSALHDPSIRVLAHGTVCVAVDSRGRAEDVPAPGMAQAGATGSAAASQVVDLRGVGVELRSHGRQRRWLLGQVLVRAKRSEAAWWSPTCRAPA